MFNSHPVWVLGKLKTSWESYYTAPCPSENVLPALENRDLATCSLAKYSGSHILSSPIQSLIASIRSFNTKALVKSHFYLCMLPTVISCSHGIYCLMSLFSKQTHKDQVHHTSHSLFTCHKYYLLSHPSIIFTDFSFPFLLYVSWSKSIFIPLRPLQTLCHSRCACCPPEVLFPLLHKFINLEDRQKCPSASFLHHQCLWSCNMLSAWGLGQPDYTRDSYLFTVWP